MRTLKPLVLLVILGLAAPAGACLTSLEPLYTEKDLILDPALEGQWSDGGTTLTLTLTNTEEKSYEAVFASNPETGQKPQKFLAHLVKLKKVLFLDLFPQPEKNEASGFLQSHLVPFHSFARLKLEGDALELAWMDYSWFEKMIKEKKIRIAHQVLADDRIVVTADTKRLQKFALKYASNPDAYPNPWTLQRKK